MSLKLLAHWKKPEEKQIQPQVQPQQKHPFTRSYFEDHGIPGYQYLGYRFFPSNYTFVEEILNLNPKPKSVLELGGGRGYITKLLEAKGIRAVCVDVSEYCYHTRATDSFCLHDVTDIPWPFKDKEFDLCVSRDFFEHIPPDKVCDVIRESARVSRRGFHAITFDSHPTAREDPTHLCLRSREWWVNQFGEIVPSDYPYRIVDKEEIEQKPIRLPPDDGLVKLNIGSYMDMFHYGWHNLDILDLSEYAKAYGYNFRQVDVLQGIPYPDDSVDIINASHVLEHFSYEDGEKFLRECFRVLKPGGVIRITVPDPAVLSRLYLDGKLLETVLPFSVKAEKSSTDCEIFWSLLTDGHKSAYDEKTLATALRKAGFVEIRKMSFGVSRSKVIEEQVIDMYPTISLYVEAEKPGVVEPVRQVQTQAQKAPLKVEFGGVPGKSVKPDKVCLVSTPFFGLPPPQYSGLENIVYWLACELAKLGVEVTVVCPKGSTFPEDLNIQKIECHEPIHELYVNWLEEEMKMYHIFKPHLINYDGVIHNHGWWGTPYLLKAQNPDLRVCQTFHAPMYNWRTLPPGVDNPNIVVPSRMHADHVKQTLGVDATVIHHGIDISKYPFKAEKGDRYLSLNRIMAEKGIDCFIDIMQRTGSKGDVVGEDKFVSDQNYVNLIKSRCVGEIRYYGTVSHEDKVRFLQDAKALVALPMLSRGFIEIWGLYITESLSCGTPVIGLKNGGLIEQIEDGVTGFLCNDLAEVEEVIRANKVEEIDPVECRKRVEKYFTKEVMSAAYLDFYRTL